MASSTLRMSFEEFNAFADLVDLLSERFEHANSDDNSSFWGFNRQKSCLLTGPMPRCPSWCFILRVS
jgi:hypothetical protein